jgi:hypothetical protein
MKRNNNAGIAIQAPLVCEKKLALTLKMNPIIPKMRI